MTERIIKWNEQRGLLNSFDMQREVGFTLSEDLEMLQWKKLALFIMHGIDHSVVADSDEHCELEKIYQNGTHDDFARWLVNNFWREENTKADFLDKCADQRVFIDGGMAKCFCTADESKLDGHVIEYLCDDTIDFVMSANELKPQGKVDEHGKQTKPDNFHLVDPKEKIQGLLDDLGIEG